MAGETQVVDSGCMLEGKLRKNPNLIMHLIPFENIPLSFESKGYISRNHSGQVVIKLTNYAAHPNHLTSRTAVGCIVLQPYSVEK